MRVSGRGYGVDEEKKSERATGLLYEKNRVCWLVVPFPSLVICLLKNRVTVTCVYGRKRRVASGVSNFFDVVYIPALYNTQKINNELAKSIRPKENLHSSVSTPVASIF